MMLLLGGLERWRITPDVAVRRGFVWLYITLLGGGEVAFQAGAAALAVLAVQQVGRGRGWGQNMMERPMGSSLDSDDDSSPKKVAKKDATQKIGRKKSRTSEEKQMEIVHSKSMGYLRVRIPLPMGSPETDVVLKFWRRLTKRQRPHWVCRAIILYSFIFVLIPRVGGGSSSDKEFSLLGFDETQGPE